jgi:hypothetical protein
VGSDRIDWAEDDGSLRPEIAQALLQGEILEPLPDARRRGVRRTGGVLARERALLWSGLVLSLLLLLQPPRGRERLPNRVLRTPPAPVAAVVEPSAPQVARAELQPPSESVDPPEPERAPLPVRTMSLGEAHSTSAAAEQVSSDSVAAIPLTPPKIIELRGEHAARLWRETRTPATSWVLPSSPRPVVSPYVSTRTRWDPPGTWGPGDLWPPRPIHVKPVPFVRRFIRPPWLLPTPELRPFPIRRPGIVRPFPPTQRIGPVMRPVQRIPAFPSRRIPSNRRGW